MMGTHAQPSEADVYDDGHLRVEHENYYVSCGGEEVRLRRKEFLIVSLLARRAGSIVTAGEIWAHAWGDSAPFDRNTFKVHVYRARRQLEPFGVGVGNRPGGGYWLESGPRDGRPEAGGRPTHTGA